jgi:hypothetical protein
MRLSEALKREAARDFFYHTGFALEISPAT